MTLVELLLVLAIIAVIAVISFPYYREKQVLSNLAKVEVSQRDLATALETYFAFYQSYPPNNIGTTKSVPGAGEGMLDALILLSTPIAYIPSSFLEDPFGKDCGLLKDGRSLISYFNSEQSDADFKIATDAAAATRGQKRSLFDHGFWLTSAGPDRISRIHEIAIANDGDCANIKSTDFVELVDELLWCPHIYDPTNGVISSGDIIRTRKGTFKPPFTTGIPAF